MQNDNTAEELTNNVIPIIRLAPDLPVDEQNWLWKLPVDTRFLAQERQITNFVLDEYIIISKSDAAVYLEYIVSESDIHVEKIKHWVDPVYFSKRKRLFEVLSWEE